ncbi:hypothetical protein [uncultured Polaribacter sp.]|uniref:hypothetical protein n=1 Tax=uncultured Polaribacter sp. TaxID=174711 RepID=UPI00263A2E46|nr:hypothetical protein [uncultured Polaribacter sp.]
MNSHLNLFKTYTKENKERQLENDLTRAFAICLLENNMFLHSILKTVLKESVYSNLFSNFEGKSNLKIDIQKRVNELESFDKLYAVSVSGFKMKTDDFYAQTFTTEFQPITDMVISIDNVVVIFEVKRDNTDCTAQLFNQALNALKTQDKNNIINISTVTAVDLCWSKLVKLSLKINNFQKSINNTSRFLNDFIEFVKTHNYRWFPELPLSAVKLNKNLNRVEDRIKTAISNSNYESLVNRIGFKINVGWASEVIFRLDKSVNTFDAYIYPGNTKGQGYSLFTKEGEPKFVHEIHLNGNTFKIEKSFHIKFTSFQKYFQGLEGKNSDTILPMITKANFRKISGRKKRGANNWKNVEVFFDKHLKPEYEWRGKCNWIDGILKSGKNQFDLSLGFMLRIKIPFEILQNVDTSENNIIPLIEFLEKIKNEFEKIVIQ